MFEKMLKFRNLDIPLHSPLSYLRLSVYLIILYLLFNYYPYIYIWFICPILLIATFFLPYPKIDRWRPAIIGYSVTGGLAFLLIKTGIVRFGIFSLIFGIAISSWLIPHPVVLIMFLLFLIATMVGALAAPVDSSPPAAYVMKVQQVSSADMEVDIDGSKYFDNLLLSPTISLEAEKVDKAYDSNIAEELTDIGLEVWQIIFDPQKRAEFIASEIVSRSIDKIGLVGVIALENLIAKMIIDRKSKKSTSLRQVNTDIKSITDYLEMVTKSRRAEMVNATGISEEKISALLDYLRSIGMLVHEKACFWRFTTETDVDL